MPEPRKERAPALAQGAGDERFAFDSYRRFIQMYSDVVLGVDHGVFEDLLESYKNLAGHINDTDLDADAWRELIEQYKDAVSSEKGKPFPFAPLGDSDARFDTMNGG